MNKTLAAFTPINHPTPEYLCVSEIDGDRIEVTVRAPMEHKGVAPGVAGPTAAIVMTANEFLRVFTDAVNNYGLNKHLQG